MEKPVSTRSLIPDGPAQINAVADFAEQGWTFRVGTASDRSALPTDEKFIGLTWQDTDSGTRRYVWDGSAWVARSWVWGVRFGANTASTGILRVNHSLGVTPDWVQVSIANTADDLLNQVASAIVWGSPTSTYVDLRFRRHDTSVYFGVNSFAGYLTVGKN